jgi:hypothetical protein
MKISFEDDHSGVSSAAKMANDILINATFYNRIKAHNNFDLCTASPSVIADLIQSSNLVFMVNIFYPNVFQAIKYRKTLAFTDPRYPNMLFLNFKKLNREIESIAATIIHEAIHALDDEQVQFTFGHGNNSSVGKENTAPYWIGNLAFKILKGDMNVPSLAFDQPENGPEFA